MKIFIINSVCGIRSTGRICSDLAKTLENKGHIVKVAYGRANVPKEYSHFVIRVGSFFTTCYNILKARLFDADGMGSAIATYRLIRQIDSFNPDVIHLHNLHGYYINIKVLFDFFIKRNYKIVWTFHDMWPLTGHGCICERQNCFKWKSSCSKCPYIHSYPCSYIDRSNYNFKLKSDLFNKVDNLTIVTPSKWLYQIVKQSFLMDKNALVIHNGIDTTTFKPVHSLFRSKFRLTDKIIVLGCSTWWGKEKGLFDFYELAKLLDDRFVIVLVGLSKNQITNLQSNMIGIERTNNIHELVEIYSAADVFVNPTYIDNFPTVNLEALSCGTPVLTYDSGGSSECINNNNGIVFPCGEIAAIAKFLNEDFSDYSFNLSDTDIFDKDKCFNLYLNLYQRLINE